MNSVVIIFFCVINSILSARVKLYFIIPIIFINSLYFIGENNFFNTLAVNVGLFIFFVFHEFGWDK